ncbi:SDR family NAD(P)-dependent oxidoreductase [Rhodococcus oryzae]|uniref:SDR family NAD(P)-dependent oxidoreductase n=1 Tax=Rhodococcus oryzae TaxID=2571143 RepID=UPI00371ACEBA
MMGHSMGSSIQARMMHWMLQPQNTLRRSPIRRNVASETSIAGLLILVTGASSGIGRAAAIRLAELGGVVILVARRAGELETVRAEIDLAGGTAHAVACDLTDEIAVADLATTVFERWGTVDVLINNAGRSIRRSIGDSLDRFHDFERTMAVNYFGAVALTLRLLPAMLERGHGHIINVGTAGAQTGTMPMFGAYGGSKAALTMFGRTLGAEMREHGISVTTVQYPLVDTPMVAPAKGKRTVPALTAQEAAGWLVTAIRTRPITLYPRFIPLLRVADSFFPEYIDKALLKES